MNRMRRNKKNSKNRRDTDNITSPEIQGVPASFIYGSGVSDKADTETNDTKTGIGTDAITDIDIDTDSISVNEVYPENDVHTEKDETVDNAENFATIENGGDPVTLESSLQPVDDEITEPSETLDIPEDNEEGQTKTKRIRRHRNNEGQKSRKPVIAAIVIMGLLIAGGVGFLVLWRSEDIRVLAGENDENAGAYTDQVFDGTAEYIPDTEDRDYREIHSILDFGEEKWDEGTVLYDGKHYRYNDKLRIYLFMGIDNDDPVAPAKNGLEGGQSDAMFLMALDDDRQKMDIIAINRNTMVPVDVYDTEGNFLVRMPLQICLQHGYGDGMKLSCMRSTEAVQRLFGYIPISGYLSLNMGGFASINDAVGGIELTPIQSINWLDAGIEEGQTITLDGKQAYAYMRYRDINESGTSDQRLERQKQYISAFIEKIMNDRSLANKMITEGSDYIVASIDLPKIVDSAKDMKFETDGDIYSLIGETRLENGYESFYPDENELIKLIINVFYEEVD